jgi:manganese/zinc/iron transport system permease protein
MEIFSTINAVYVMIGSLVLGACGGLLGAFSVLKKQGLLSDALAHASLPGIVIAFLIMQVKFLPGLLLGALISGLVGAAVIYFLERETKLNMDTAMAVVLSVFFGIGVLLLTYLQNLPISAQSGLETFLFGQAASLLKNDVVWMLISFFVILAVVLVFWKELKMFVFDPEFSRVIGFRRGMLEFIFMAIFVVAVLLSLQAVGVVLTAALFITPAVSALYWSNRFGRVVMLSTFFGMVSGGIGAYISSVFPKMPTGPVIVLVATAIFVFSFLFAPKRGLISRFFVQRKQSIKVQIENVLGKLYRDFEKGIDIWRGSDFKLYGYRPLILSRMKRRKYLEIVDDNDE